jgi:hypothetical protein
MTRRAGTGLTFEDMRPVLDTLELPQVQEITTIERRVVAEHKHPGMEGSILQNMGTRPTRLTIQGIATGASALSFIQRLEELFQSGKSLSFMADIVADARVEEVIIDDLRTQEMAGKPQRYSYALTLREYIEPVEPEDVSVLEAAIADEARSLIDNLVPGLDIGVAFATGLERFVAPLSDLLERLKEARKRFENARGK